MARYSSELGRYLTAEEEARVDAILDYWISRVLEFKVAENGTILVRRKHEQLPSCPDSLEPGDPDAHP